MASENIFRRGMLMLNMTEGRMNWTIGAAHWLGLVAIDNPKSLQFPWQKLYGT
jgi:hypothetical protein